MVYATLRQTGKDLELPIPAEALKALAAIRD